MDYSSRPVVICDIDDTVSVVGKRRALLSAPVVDWDLFYEDDFDDKPIPSACRAVIALLDNGVRVVFATSRSERCREKTLSWLRRHISPEITDEMVMMRADGDRSSEADQKVGDVLSRFRAKDIILAIDDNRSILDAWREAGVQTIDSRLLAQA